MIANAIVRPKLFMNRPTMPPMNATGTKIATSDSVVASTARPISLVPSIAAWNWLIVLLLDEAVDVLQHDDRVVDHDADRQRQRQHRQHVEREAHEPDQAERGDDRRRDGDGGDERRAQVRQEQQHDERRQNRPDDEVFLDVVDRRFDELRRVADDRARRSRAAAPA